MATNPIPAIDMWAPIVGTPEIIRQAVEHFPERMLGYLRVFFKHTGLGSKKGEGTWR